MEYTYRFIKTNESGTSDDGELCTITTTIEIDAIIREYRGQYSWESQGYRHQKGVYQARGEMYADKGQPIFKVLKKDDSNLESCVCSNIRNRLTYSGSGNSSYVDIRRIIGDILWCLYCGKIFDGEVKKIILNGDTYEGIENVQFRDNEDHRIMFDDKAGRTILVPIDLHSNESNLATNSMIGLYILREGGTNLNILGKRKVFDNKSNEYSVDLFCGEYKNKRGMFFYFRNELKSLYAIDENSTIEASDLRKTFFYNVYSEIFKDENVEENEKDNSYNSYEFLTFDRELQGKFERWMKKKIWETIKKWFVKQDYKPVEGENFSFRISFKTEKYSGNKSENNTCLPFEYYNKLVEVDSERTDWNFLWKKLGKIEKGEISITLGTELKNWIFEKKGVWCANKEMLSNVGVDFSSLVVPKDVVNIDGLRKYLKDNKDLLDMLFEKIIEACSNSDKEKYLKENSISPNVYDKKEIIETLYPGNNVYDESIVNIIYEAKKKYEKDGKLPNFAIMGGPGTGKSTIAKNIAKCLKGNDREDLVLYKSTSDLKGAFVGHTGARMYDLIVTAAKEDKIIFIDEAYSLLEDRYGQEALEICLPLLTGDRKSIDRPPMEGQSTQTYDFEKENTKIPAIWLAGYEHEMRKMLSKNPGLYRRMKKISLPSPTVDGLYNCLLGKADNTEVVGKLKECRDEIRNYFSWAISNENVNYFGNYAGVNDFLETCEIRLEKEDNYKDIILGIIEEKKREIKKQYKAILEDVDKIKFEIQNEVDVILDDIKGNNKVVSNLKDIVTMMLNQKDYSNKGIRLPKGALLVGPPGTGKTMLARAVAGELQKEYREKEEKNVSIAFIATVATELDEPQKIKALFQTASEYDFSILFIDEIDAIGKHRNMPGAVPGLLIQLMKELDGFEERKNMFVMAATNAPELLDPALKRPGRFDRNIEVTYPDKAGRKAILKSALRKLSFLEEKDVENVAGTLAEKTIQYAPANLINLVNEAAILYEKCEASCSKQEHRKDLGENPSNAEKFEADVLEMLERFNVGELNSVKKDEKFQSETNEGCSAVAIHEVGHAMVSILSGMKEPFDRITIISRGDALGYVSPSSKNRLRTKKDFINQIRVCLGGRVAEEMFYGDNISTGAVQDIQQATQYAKNMITLFGMSDAIGMMALQTNEKSYLGDNSSYICSDSFRYEVDDAIRKLLSEQMSITRNMLESHKEEIEEMAKFIFDNETVDGTTFIDEYHECCKRIEAKSLGAIPPIETEEDD